MGSLLAVVFIAGMAAVGILVGTRPTVADGKVIAETIVKGSKKHGLAVQCDDKIPIGVEGAVFRCTIAADDGSTARVQYTMNRAGSYSADVLDSTGPTRGARRRVGGGTGDDDAPAPSGDPWD